MKISEEDRFLFNEPRAKKYVSRSRLPQANALIPLTYSDRPQAPRDFAYSTDPRMLRATEYLAEKLTTEFPRDVDESTGYAGASAVPGDFRSLLCVSGMGSDPLPIPVYSNDKFVASLGLSAGIRSGDTAWFKEIIRLFFGHATAADLHINKESSSGFPYFTKEVQYRKMATLKCLHQIDDYLACMTGGEGDLQRGLEQYHSLHIYAIQERQQAESVTLESNGSYSSKKRVYPTEAQARSGDFSGEGVVDNSVHDPATGSVIPNHFSMRRRPVFGYSGIPNYVMTAVLGCFRKVYLTRFDFTYKARGDADKEEKIRRYKYIVGSDVKNMDTTVPRWFFEFLLSELPKYWDERLVEMLRRMLAAPYVVPSPWRQTPADYNPVFGGSPLKPTSFTACVGLPSGVAINPDIGKLWMTCVYIALFKDSGALHAVTEIEPFLQGKNPDHGMLDSSDDANLMTNSLAVRAKLREAKSPYAVLQPEIPVIYLGSVFCMINGERRSVPNPITYVVNMLCREDSIARKNVVDYSEGVIARFQQYSATPIFRDMNLILEETMRKQFGVNPFLIARAMAKRQRFEDVDALVKANPHYLHYRVDPADVSKEVLNELVATIPATDFFDRIRHLFKVPTTTLGELDGSRQQ